MKMTKNSTLSLHIKTVAFCAVYLLLTNTAQACDISFADFEVKNNSVYWGYGNRTDDADKVTFKFNGTTITPDAASFQSFGVTYNSRPAYSKDKAHVFYGFNVVPNADPSTFEPVRNTPPLWATYYGKDKNRVFYEDVEVIGADLSSFEPLSTDRNYAPDYARDNAHIYVAGKAAPLLDMGSFKVLDVPVYNSDKNAVYYLNTKIQEANPADVRFEQDYLISNHKVFKDGKKTTFDGDSFKVVQRKYRSPCGLVTGEHEILQDKNGRYLDGKPM